MFARRQPKLGVFSTSLPLFLQESSFKKRNQAPLFLCLIGRAVCDGREADLYETPARQPLHAGPGLFKDLFIRALPLHSLWFWMVFISTLIFPQLGLCVNSDPSTLLFWNFFHCTFTKQPALLWAPNPIALNYSLLYTFVRQNRNISLQNLILL